MCEITTFIFFIYGIIFGSFFNVVGLRVPNNSLFSPTRSYCDTCQRTLTWKELIPIVSYIFQKGKCRKCKESISAIYPIMELTTGLLAAYTFYRYGWSRELLFGLVLISLVVPLTVSDLAYRKIPNKILLFFCPLFLLLRMDDFVQALLGATVAFVILFLVTLLSKGGMGAGDLKYFTLLGFIFGTYPFLLLFFLSTLYGAVGGIIVMAVKKSGRKTKIPFGPFIGLAALTVFYFGEGIIQWYLVLLS
ncbi:prepilin peptidase [Jeotgalibaca ciconiae]|uniref:Prepilin peptidase n=1 Tax=Jeotgalibaca ciconiae TaxID=2496265 RepID=A0A3S9H8J4_9LACT|nr:A24 family peptidase [Jeotgalibaca ciconiae]AZP03672.1 prepilin peptidase [Jeotgalibaca ciconiae]